ncbi:MAG TPA: hypothetical protein PLZ15_12805 [Melioribacteraceae bacterium]|nr:hypothetical protein [Melioribacteraceae bacterium]
MQELNENKNLKEYIKKYLPVSSLIILTLFLMIFFRYNKRDINRLIEEGKNNLVSFYAQNLKPLFATTEISNEDVFNFALYQSLPIDKENNRVLLVSDEISGNQVYEIKPSTFIPNTYNYNNYTDFFELSPGDKLKADSILNTYKKEIYLSVLTNEKNALAINPKLGELQKAVLADLIAFSEQVNYEKANKLFQMQNKLLSGKNLTTFTASAKEFPGNDYIFITPDTVLQTEFEFDTREFDKLKDLELDLKLAEDKLKNIRIQYEPPKPDRHPKRTVKGERRFVHQFDSSFVKVVIPFDEITAYSSAVLSDSIKANLKKAANKLRMLTVNWEDQKHNYTGKSPIPPPKPPKNKESLEFQLNFNPQAFAKQAIEMVSKGNIEDWEKFGARMDSIAKAFEKQFSDSVKKRKEQYLNEPLSRKIKNKVVPKDTSGNK